MMYFSGIYLLVQYHRLKFLTISSRFPHDLVCILTGAVLATALMTCSF